ncbi:unnamed protein product [Diplocarpon coronariae]|uniref:F-box domain-containing protein n=1 Tax=Diplocarpon coronariae TaxID=2795749 RepID=A0A218ZGM9_9HELO|nr:hypothetical protein JHW43_000102 [Diplocarpon mali]OWP06713.1 hypothetical protein B2J93_5192 [Marssonina coronariae]
MTDRPYPSFHPEMRDSDAQQPSSPLNAITASRQASSMGFPVFSGVNIATGSEALTLATSLTVPAPSSDRNMPRISGMPLELLMKIIGNIDDAGRALLSLTCRNMRQRVPFMKLSLETVVVETPSFYSVASNKRRLWSFLKEYMHPLVYAGNYNVYKFLTPEEYSRARDAYWNLYPPLPVEIFPLPGEDEMERSLEELEEVTDVLGKLSFVDSDGVSLAFANSRERTPPPPEPLTFNSRDWLFW